MSLLESMKVGGSQRDETPFFFICLSKKVALLLLNKLPSRFSTDTLGTCVIFEENVEHGK